MKVINFAVAAAAILVFPVLLCSCTSDPAKKENKSEVQTPKTTAADEPKAVEITSESSFAAAEAPAKAEPAKAAEAPAQAEPAKAAAEPAKAAEAPAQAEPAKAAAEPVKAAEAPAQAEPAKAAAEPAKAEPPCEHTVRTGDNLWKISHRYYGSGKNWKKIYEANKSQIKKPEFLEPGTVLKIPAK